MNEARRGPEVPGQSEGPLRSRGVWLAPVGGVAGVR